MLVIFDLINNQINGDQCWISLVDCRVPTWNSRIIKRYSMYISYNGLVQILADADVEHLQTLLMMAGRM